MVFKINQQTFDDAVKENINDLGLTPEEALKETVEQFKAQDVDLSEIAIEYVPESDSALILEQIKNLSQKTTANDVIDQLNMIRLECDKGIQHRVLIGKCGAYSGILEIYHKWNDKSVQLNSLKCLISLMTKQPDLLNDNGSQTILENLNLTGDQEIQILTLKWAKQCCIMHEMNRQNLVNANIVNKLKILFNDEATPEMLRDILSVLRALCLDDDVRVEFGKAHEHARIIANETINIIIDLLNRFKTDENLINDSILTLSGLLVRAEYCRQVEEAGCLELIRNVMIEFLESDNINRQCFKLIKALTGNDECKVHLIQKGLAPAVFNSLKRHKGSAQTTTAGLNCVAALSLRCPDNSKALFEAGLPDIIVEIMKNHPNEKSVQKSASWAVRNMVSRSRYQNGYFLELGIEELLKNNLRQFDEFQYDTKAALRDLECNVNFKEEWTGKGGKLTSSAYTNLDMP